MFAGLYSALEQSEVITLYRHINPDCDALGSQWGLATWLKHRFPLKRVIVLGHQKMTNGLFPDSDEIDDETVRQSLAIVLDTANVRRIDDERWQSARQIIHLDHHPQIEHFADLESVSYTHLSVDPSNTHRRNRPAVEGISAGLSDDG